MADTKIHDLTELASGGFAVDDEFPLLDRSDTSMDADGTNKRTKFQALQLEMAKAGKYPPDGVTLQNFDRFSTTAGSVSPTSGVLRMQAIWLPAGFTVTSISFMSVGGLTLGTSPHFWVALFDSSRALLRQSTDDTAASWAATTLKTTNLSSTFTTTYSGLHYCGILVAQTGGAVPTYLSNVVSASIHNLTPSLSGASTTGLTGTAPNPAAALTAGATNAPWCGVA